MRAEIKSNHRMSVKLQKYHQEFSKNVMHVHERFQSNSRAFKMLANIVSRLSIDLL